MIGILPVLNPLANGALDVEVADFANFPNS